MERPDQEKYQKFVKPLLIYDTIWQEYAKKYGYILELNQYRKPGRMLRSPSHLSTSYVIELYMEPIWHYIDYEDDLPYTVSICAFHKNSKTSELRWRLAKTIIENTSLELIGVKLNDYLNQAFALVNEWTSGYITKHGELFELRAHGWIRIL
jgi:hypothetical protein